MNEQAEDQNARTMDLIQQLTLKEKFQMLSSPGLHRLYSTKGIKRLGIPAFKVTDGPLGVAYQSSRKKATRFPVTIAVAATWNRDLARDMGRAMGEEVRYAGRHMLLAPGINIARTPLNGRTFEYFSEDPYLTAELGAEVVNGVQSQGVGACLKHFAANNQDTDRRKSSSEIDERTLHEIYLRAFRSIVIRAQPMAIMAAYNRLNGVYCSESEYLLKEVLMNRWGFEGFVMTDWFAGYDAKSPAQSIHAGLSLEMPRPSRYKTSKLKKSYEAGEFTEENLDDLVSRFIRVLFKTGAFDAPAKTPKNVSTDENQILARRIAQESFVLLKNEGGVLPLSRDEMVCVQGPNLRKRYGKFLHGGSSAVIPPFEVTPLDAMKEKSTKLIVDDKLACVVKSDAIVLFMGLDHKKGNDAESGDRKTLALPRKQVKFIKEFAHPKKKKIVVLMAGSPIVMDDWIDDVDAVLMAWYPGMTGSFAIADVLYGDAAPSGKLPITFPRRLEDSPAHSTLHSRNYPGDEENRVHYDEGIFVGYRWFDEKEREPLFPFGYGMSYTEFNLESPRVANDNPLQVEIDITNVGGCDGAEVIQVYASDVESSVKRPPKELVGFAKVHLKPGETKTVRILIDAMDLAFYDVDQHDWKLETGEFMLMIGTSSRDLPLSLSIKI
jgi:beta-glucosidase